MTSLPPQGLLHPRFLSISGSSVKQDFQHPEMPRKSKGKEIATHKGQASSHDLNKVSTTVKNACGSSEFSPVIKFPSSSSAKDTPAQEVMEGITSDTQATEAGESSVALDNSPSAATIR